jgi:hypothetical protein
MLKHSMKKTWLICVLAISGCASNGNVRQIPVCPVLPPAPANLMQPPTNEQQTRQILFESPQTQTRPSKPYSKS